MFAKVNPDTHMRLSQGTDYDHVVFYAMTQLSMKAGMRVSGRQTQTTIKIKMTSATELKKSETRLKKHFRVMMIYSPRKNNLNSY